MYKAGEDVQEHDDENLVSEDIKATFRLGHQLGASPFVRAFAGNIGTVVGDLPPHHQEVIAGQIVEACKNLSFHFETLTLMDKVEVHETLWEIIADNKEFLELGDHDGQFIDLHNEANNKILVAETFGLTWDGVDLLINTIPAEERWISAANKKASIREGAGNSRSWLVSSLALQIHCCCYTAVAGLDNLDHSIASSQCVLSRCGSVIVAFVWDTSRLVLFWLSFFVCFGGGRISKLLAYMFPMN